MKTLIKILSVVLLLSLSFLTKAQVGNPAPDFTVTDTHGETHHLYEYLEAGKVVVLDFFYTTCGPCQFYSPQVNLAYEKYGCNSNQVVFISIDHNDTDDEVLAYDEEYSIQYPSVSGLEGGGNGVVAQYNILGFPTFYVIDSTLTIIEEIDPPTLQVFDFRFQQHGIEPTECSVSAIHEEKASQVLEVFPNPVGSEGILIIRLPDKFSEMTDIEIFDGLGQRVTISRIECAGESIAELNIKDLSSGFYLLRFSSDHGKLYTGCFVKK